VPASPFNHLYVLFTIDNAAPPACWTVVNWRRDLKSITKFDLLSYLKVSEPLCPFPHKFSQPDDLFASFYTGLRKAVDAVAPSRPQ